MKVGDMNGDELCTCGHVYDEHRRGGHECEVDECECVCFDYDPDGDANDDE